MPCGGPSPGHTTGRVLRNGRPVASRAGSEPSRSGFGLRVEDRDAATEGVNFTSAEDGLGCEVTCAVRPLGCNG